MSKNIKELIKYPNEFVCTIVGIVDTTIDEDLYRTITFDCPDNVKFIQDSANGYFIENLVPIHPYGALIIKYEENEISLAGLKCTVNGEEYEISGSSTGDFYVGSVGTEYTFTKRWDGNSVRLNFITYSPNINGFYYSLDSGGMSPTFNEWIEESVETGKKLKLNLPSNFIDHNGTKVMCIGIKGLKGLIATSFSEDYSSFARIDTLEEYSVITILQNNYKGIAIEVELGEAS